MGVWRASRHPVRAASAVVLALGVVAGSVAGAGAAQARPVLRIQLHSAAVSWGDNENGQLGNGSTAARTTYAGVSGLSSGVAQVSAGLDNSVALTTDGTVWTWGDAAALGNGSTTNSTVAVHLPGLSSITKVSAGYGFDLALRSDGTVWAWGTNSLGQLGDGNTAASGLTPVQVTGLTGVTQIAAGSQFGLALRSDGTVWSWGFNDFGQLGDGSRAEADVPVPVTGLSLITQIAAGGSSAMAVQSLPFRGAVLWSVWDWGRNTFGQLGDGTTTEHSTPEQVSGIGVPTVAQIAVGGNFSMLLGSDGSLWGWGLDSDGELGVFSNITDDVLRPVESYFPNTSGFTSIAAGPTDMLALRSDGTVLAWGKGLFGTGTDSPGHVTVPGLTSVTQISAGGDYSLAVHQVRPIFLGNSNPGTIGRPQPPPGSAHARSGAAPARL